MCLEWNDLALTIPMKSFDIISKKKVERCLEQTKINFFH